MHKLFHTAKCVAGATFRIYRRAKSDIWLAIPPILCACGMEISMQKYIWETPQEINMLVANNAKNIRKRKGISQQKLSKLSGVSYGSIKRFEETGNISLISLTKIAVVLDAVNGIKALFTEVTYNSIQEVINEQR